VHSFVRLRALPLVLAVIAALGTGSATARGAPEHSLPITSNVPCANRPTPHKVSAVGDSQRYPTSTAVLHQYSDYIEDVASAPDICGSNVVTNDNVAITVAIHVHDRTAFAPADSYRIDIDIDSNPATGAPAEAGPLSGAEYVIDLADEQSALSAWNGSAFAPVVPQPEVPTVWVDGYGPVLEIDRLALGNPTSFNLLISTGNGADRDLAPDAGSWPYVVTPLQLTPGRLHLGPALPGKPLVAAMQVERSDFEIALEEGSIACGAKLAERKLVGRGRFAGEIVTCTWRIPKNTRGMRIAGGVAVTFQGVTARRSFHLRVK